MPAPPARAKAMQQRASDLSLKTKLLVSLCMGVRQPKHLIRNKNKTVGRFFGKKKQHHPNVNNEKQSSRESSRVISIYANRPHNVPLRTSGKVDRGTRERRLALWRRDGAARFRALLLCMGHLQKQSMGVRPLSDRCFCAHLGRGCKTQIKKYIEGDSIHLCADSPYSHRCGRVGHRPRQVVPLPIVEMVLVRVSGPKQRRPE